MTISSVGLVATTMRGGTFGAGSPESSLGMFATRSAGGDEVGVQGPSGSRAVYHCGPLVR